MKVRPMAIKMDSVLLSDLLNLEDDAIAHYGTPGMKWGVRKYQNPDGSLTSAGRARYLKNGGKDPDTELPKKSAPRTTESRFVANIKNRIRGIGAHFTKTTEKATNVLVKRKDDGNAKKQYDDMAAKASKAEEKTKKKLESVTKSIKEFAKMKDKLSDMSDEELERVINRKKLEQAYREVERNDHPGRQYAIKTLQTLGTTIAKNPSLFVEAAAGIKYITTGHAQDIDLERERGRNKRAEEKAKRESASQKHRQDMQSQRRAQERALQTKAIDAMLANPETKDEATRWMSTYMRTTLDEYDEAHGRTVRRPKK